MNLIKKIFNRFFLLKFFFTIIVFTKLVLANNTNETNVPILERLPTSIFATVNNDPISIYDLIQRSNLFSVSAKIPINEEFETKILPDLISNYIDQIIQMQEIKKENVLVNDKQVEDIVSKIEQDNGFKKGEFKNFLKENKTEISILEKQVFVSIGWKQLIATKFRSQVMIQDTEIDTIHNKLKSNIGKKEFFIEQIFISFENKNENEVLNKINNLYKQILGGGDFVSIATQFSDKFGGKAGKMGWIPEVDLDSKILNKIKKLEINKTSKPLKGENGYFIIRVLSKRTIGEEIISQVSLFRFKLIETNEETNSLINKIKNCDELKNFSKKYATEDSGSLGNVNYAELSNNLKTTIIKMEKNQISPPLKFGSEEFQIMTCDIKKIKPIIPSKFKIRDMLTNKKLDTIARQYMSELRSKTVIDIRI